MNKLYNIKYCKFDSKKNHLNDLVEILSIAIDKQNIQMLIYLTNRWNRYHLDIRNENNHCFIINNSNQLNHINYLMKEANYIISIRNNNND